MEILLGIAILLLLGYLLLEIYRSQESFRKRLEDVYQLGKLEGTQIKSVDAKWILVDNDKHSGVCSHCFRSDHIDPLATYCRYCGAMIGLSSIDARTESTEEDGR